MARVQTNAGWQPHCGVGGLELLYRVADRQRGQTGLLPRRSVWLGGWPDGQDAVANDVRHNPAMLLYRLKDRGIIGIHESSEFSRLHGFGEGGVLHYICKQTRPIDHLVTGFDMGNAV